MTGFASHDEITKVRKQILALPPAEDFPNKTWLISNGEDECSMFLTTPSMNYNWVSLDCNRLLQKASFICEESFNSSEPSTEVSKLADITSTTPSTTEAHHPIKRSIKDDRENYLYMPRNNVSCRYAMTYVKGTCYRLINNTLSTVMLPSVMPFSIMDMTSNMGRYLTVWTLPHVNKQTNVQSLITVLYEQDRSGEDCNCWQSNSIFYLEHKIWKRNRCSCMGREINYVLKITRSATFTETCDEDSQFTCVDGTCISYSYQCDGFDDCLDISDEFQCHHICTDR